MTARVPVVWWPPTGPDFATGLNLRAWVLAVAVPPHAPRAQARERLRAAVCAGLAHSLGIAPSAVVLHASPGQAPSVEGHPEIGLSFSHAPGVSLAAIHLEGPVGVDLQADEVPDDWRSVARDFLGPEVLARLDCAQGRGFAAEWSALEAALKCGGQPLQEWRAGGVSSRCASGCVRAMLDLPAGWVGCVAFPSSPAA